MKKNTISLITILVITICGLWFLIAYKEKNTPATPTTGEIMLFYGRECPHCKDVEKFIEKNKIEEKVGFDSLEVWHNKANGEIMSNKARECGFSEDQLGVPFLYAKGKCFIGGPEVENFFKQEAGI